MHTSTQSTLWLDGQLQPSQSCSLSPLTHSLHYGTGCFEGIRAYKTPQGTCIFRLDEHTQRLFNSAKLLGITLPYDHQTLVDAQIDVVKTNQLSDAYIRPLVFYGDETIGLDTAPLSVHCLIAVLDMTPNLSKLNNGIHVTLSNFNRLSPQSNLSQAKTCGSYLNSVLALQKARQLGAEDTILLDHTGAVAEASGSNIFIVKNNKLLTPNSISRLNGITKQTVMQLAEEFDIFCEETTISQEDCLLADEVFLCGTAVEIKPVIKIDQHNIGSGVVGPVTQQLMHAYERLVRGLDPHHQSWLTPVYE